MKYDKIFIVTAFMYTLFKLWFTKSMEVDGLEHKWNHNSFTVLNNTN